MAKKLKLKDIEIEYDVSYRNVRYPRLEFKTGNLLVILPQNYQNEIALIEKHREWLYKQSLAIKTSLEEAKDKKLVNRTDKELNNLVHSIVENSTKGLNYKVNKIYFKRMKSKWASCNSDRNLTVNTLLRYLPKNLIEYVIFHEIAHLQERKHNAKFWKMISKKFKDYQTMGKELLTYWFLIQKRLSK